jgi:hypothetical protein
MSSKYDLAIIGGGAAGHEIRRKFLAVEIAVGLGKLDLGAFDLVEAKRLVRRALELIGEGLLSYTLISARKR